MSEYIVKAMSYLTSNVSFGGGGGGGDGGGRSQTGIGVGVGYQTVGRSAPTERGLPTRTAVDVSRGLATASRGGGLSGIRGIGGLGMERGYNDGSGFTIPNSGPR